MPALSITAHLQHRDDAVDKKLFSGDPTAIDDLKQARALWERYKGLTVGCRRCGCAVRDINSRPAPRKATVAPRSQGAGHACLSNC